MKKIYLLLPLLILLSSCASKRYAKKAAEFEAAGLYKDAAEYYYQSVVKKDTNVEAKLGLRKNGQLVLDDMLAEFTRTYKQNENKKAVYHFLEAEKYFNKIKGAGVGLSFPDYHREYYEDARSDYLQKRYADGVNKLSREEFDDALKVFQEIQKINSNFKDVNEKIIVAKYEPMYRQANEQLDNGLYRSAYYTFERILRGTDGYKQSLALKEEALKRGTITILIPEINHSYYSHRDAAQTVTNRLKGMLGKTNNPFIEMVEPASLSRSIYDPQTGKIDFKAAELAGIEAVLYGSIESIKTNNGLLQKEEKRGYVKEVKKVKNKEGKEVEKVTYHKTVYLEYHRENSASLGLNFRLVSSENNQVMISDQVLLKDDDVIHYASFSGKNRDLVPGYWKYRRKDSPEDVIKDNRFEIMKLRSLLNANREIKSSDALLDGLFNQAASHITNLVEAYNPEQ